MADPGYTPTQSAIEAPAGPEAPGEPASPGVNLPLLGVLLLILVLVSLSNVWLRRRAERENAREQEDDAP